MIDRYKEAPLPPGAMYTAFLTQEMLDEARVALGRELSAREVQLLDRILSRQAVAAHKKSKDEIMASLQAVADEHKK